MTTNLQRQAKIDELRRKLKDDIAALEKQCRSEVAALEREIKECAAQELREARARIQAIINEHGLNPDQVLAVMPKQRRAPQKTVRYVGPDGQVWSGFGRVPGWLRGKNRDAFAQPINP